jgi:G:T-mismatch repair DNA endonuclease (very short patch repair protein)
LKFRQNVERDIRNERELRDLGWRVEIVWECEGTERLDRLVEALLAIGVGAGDRTGRAG